MKRPDDFVLSKLSVRWSCRISLDPNDCSMGHFNLRVDALSFEGANEKTDCAAKNQRPLTRLLTLLYPFS